MNVLPIDPSSDPRWLTYISSVPEATVFQHPSWIQLLAESYGYGPQCLAAIDGSRVVGILPLLEVSSPFTGRRAVALPFCDFCGPVVDSQEALGVLLGAADELRMQRKWRYVEIRSGIVNQHISQGPRYKSHRLALSDDTEGVFRSFNKTRTQGSVLKALREGVLVERRTDAEAMREFIRLNALTRRKHGIPPQPDVFFWNLLRRILEPGFGFIGLARHQGIIVAAAVYLHYNNLVVYKYGASDERHLSCRPNHAVMWDAIQWACTSGYPLLDFGRTDLDNEGLLFYKRGWGTVEADLVYSRLGRNAGGQEGAGGGKLALLKPVLSRLPIPVLKLLGKGFYSHAG